MNSIEEMLNSIKLNDIITFILIIAVLYLLFRSPPCNENFETATVDSLAIKNLGDISRKIMTGGDTGVPGTFTFPANNTIFSGDNTVEGNTVIKGKLTVNGPIDFTSIGNILPKGMIIAWYNSSPVPAGWVDCDGTNDTPDLRGRTVIGRGVGTGLTNRNFKDVGGMETHTLTAAEMPEHAHYVLYNPGGDWVPDGAKVLNTNVMYNGSSSVTTNGSTHLSTSSEGGSKPHNNMQPFYTLIYIMKT